ncbi:major capsid protein [Brachybacterium timonense]|uniref:major capsid protein n=1 Tax=Brachybacterium timonense TaxID=2050896 RepID=UPI000D0B2E9B|nr:major capsid protein [Brachybacterium timonense]
MKLMTDLIDPAAITGFAREKGDQFDAAPGTLSGLFPNETVDGLTAAWTVGSNSNDLASFRAFDAESKIGGGIGLEKRQASLAAVSIKERFGEYDQLIRRGANAPETVEAAADRLAEKVAKATIDRIILARGEVLATGKLAINEDGFIQNADFGRRPDFTVTAANLWDADGDPIQDLETWMAAFEEENGVTPDVLYVSRKIQSVLMRSEKLRAYFGPTAAPMLTDTEINQQLAARGLPAVRCLHQTWGTSGSLPCSPMMYSDHGS